MVQKIIIDEDGGADTMAILAVVLANPDKFELLGVTTVFGNTTQKQALRNNGDLLALLNASHIPYYPGATGPTGTDTLDGDNAHGENGLGGVELLPTSVPPQQKQAVDFIIETLKNEPPHSVTIIAAAPQTNIAQAMKRNFTVFKRVKEIVIMGGCTEAMPAADAKEIGRPDRQGNITPDAEFNFYQAAGDARMVITSGLPITLFPMNCTQKLSLTPEREAIIRAVLPENRSAAEAIIGMMRAPLDIDRKKFDADPFMHDVHTAVYLLNPRMYEGRLGHISVTVDGPQNGKTTFKPNWRSRLKVMEKTKNPDEVFNCFLSAIKNRVAAGPQTTLDVEPLI